MNSEGNDLSKISTSIQSDSNPQLLFSNALGISELGQDQILLFGKNNDQQYDSHKVVTRREASSLIKSQGDKFEIANLKKHGYLLDVYNADRDEPRLVTVPDNMDEQQLNLLAVKNAASNQDGKLDHQYPPHPIFKDLLGKARSYRPLSSEDPDGQVEKRQYEKFKEEDKERELLSDNSGDSNVLTLSHDPKIVETKSSFPCVQSGVSYCMACKGSEPIFSDAASDVSDVDSIDEEKLSLLVIKNTTSSQDGKLERHIESSAFNGIVSKDQQQQCYDLTKEGRMRSHTSVCRTENCNHCARGRCSFAPNVESMQLNIHSKLLIRAIPNEFRTLARAFGYKSSEEITGLLFEKENWQYLMTDYTDPLFCPSESFLSEVKVALVHFFSRKEVIELDCVDREFFCITGFQRIMKKSPEKMSIEVLLKLFKKVQDIVGREKANLKKTISSEKKKLDNIVEKSDTSDDSEPWISMGFCSTKSTLESQEDKFSLAKNRLSHLEEYDWKLYPNESPISLRTSIVYQLAVSVSICQNHTEGRCMGGCNCRNGVHLKHRSIPELKTLFGTDGVSRGLWDSSPKLYENLRGKSQGEERNQAIEKTLQKSVLQPRLLSFDVREGGSYDKKKHHEEYVRNSTTTIANRILKFQDIRDQAIHSLRHPEQLTPSQRTKLEDESGSARRNIEKLLLELSHKHVPNYLVNAADISKNLSQYYPVFERADEEVSRFVDVKCPDQFPFFEKPSIPVSFPSITLSTELSPIAAKLKLYHEAEKNKKMERNKLEKRTQEITKQEKRSDFWDKNTTFTLKVDTIYSDSRKKEVVDRIEERGERSYDKTDKSDLRNHYLDREAYVDQVKLWEDPRVVGEFGRLAKDKSVWREYWASNFPTFTAFVRDSYSYLRHIEKYDTSLYLAKSFNMMMKDTVLTLSEEEFFANPRRKVLKMMKDNHQILLQQNTQFTYTQLCDPNNFNMVVGWLSYRKKFPDSTLTSFIELNDELWTLATNNTNVSVVNFFELTNYSDVKKAYKLILEVTESSVGSTPEGTTEGTVDNRRRFVHLFSKEGTISVAVPDDLTLAKEFVDIVTIITCLGTNELKKASIKKEILKIEDESLFTADMVTTCTSRFKVLGSNFISPLVYQVNKLFTSEIKSFDAKQEREAKKLEKTRKTTVQKEQKKKRRDERAPVKGTITPIFGTSDIDDDDEDEANELLFKPKKSKQKSLVLTGSVNTGGNKPMVVFGPFPTKKKAELVRSSLYAIPGGKGKVYYIWENTLDNSHSYRSEKEEGFYVCSPMTKVKSRKEEKIEKDDDKKVDEKTIRRLEDIKEMTTLTDSKPVSNRTFKVKEKDGKTKEVNPAEYHAQVNDINDLLNSVFRISVETGQQEILYRELQVDNMVTDDFSRLIKSTRSTRRVPVVVADDLDSDSDSDNGMWA